MNPTRWLVASLLLGFAVAASPADPPASLAGSAIEGRKIFQTKKCVNCHAIRGEGGTLGPDLGRLGQGRTLFELAGLFLGHSPKMIDTVKGEGLKWPEFTPQEMENLFSYLYYMNYLGEPGNFRRGEKAFEKKGCGGCHSLGSEGGVLAPKLDRLAQYMSPVLLAQEMWNKAPQMTALMQSRGIATPAFEGNDMADILAYVRGRTNLGYFERIYLPPGDPETGRKVFAEKQCSACHGAGELLRPSASAKHAPDLRQRGLDRSVSEMAGILWNHSTRMRAEMAAAGVPFPKFKGAELAHLLAYLYYLHYYEQGGDGARGAKIFEVKGCARCHGGSGVAPELASDAPPLRSPFHFASSMWNHLPSMRAAAEEEKVLLWPAFEKTEMRDLFEFLKTRESKLARK